jgi:hypothetical protein
MVLPNVGLAGKAQSGVNALIPVSEGTLMPGESLKLCELVGSFHAGADGGKTNGLFTSASRDLSVTKTGNSPPDTSPTHSDPDSLGNRSQRNREGPLAPAGEEVNLLGLMGLGQVDLAPGKQASMGICGGAGMAPDRDEPGM